MNTLYKPSLCPSVRHQWAHKHKKISKQTLNKECQNTTFKTALGDFGELREQLENKYATFLVNLHNTFFECWVEVIANNRHIFVCLFWYYY